MPHYFTFREANETLTIVRPMIRELMEISERIRIHQPELWAVAQATAGNGGNPALSKILPDFDRLDYLLHQINDMGIEVKDLSAGLIDFPALYEDRIVYLCWKFGEDRVQFWHELESGFSGRKWIDWE
ncbi:MAG: DUF2203 domain-containing protein [Chloroflexi bacterium]|nr:DUF2203 domain-containing protein [Chloroflexota bacterium]